MSPLQPLSLDSSFQQQAKRTRITATAHTGAGTREDPQEGDELAIEVMEHVNCESCQSHSKERVQPGDGSMIYLCFASTAIIRLLFAIRPHIFRILH